MYVSGGLQYVLLKVILDWKAEGLTPEECPGRKSNAAVKFERSFFSTSIIFFSMLSLVLPFYYQELKQYNEKRKEQGLPKAHPYGWRAYTLSLLPGILDIAAVEMSMLANKVLTAVAMLLLKSLRIVIAAFLTKFILHKSQKKYQWLGVIITLLGLVPVGFASQKRSEEKAKKSHEADHSLRDTLISLGLVVASEAMRGIRYVYEEKLIKVEKLSAEFVVYTESLIGLVVSLFVLLVVHKIPGDNCGSRENFYDTMRMMYNQPILWGLFAINFFLVGIHNYATTLVTKHLTSMHNQIISQARTIVAWLPGVILFKLTNGDTGQPLDKWTALDFTGFIVLGLGAFVYNGDVKIPIPGFYPSEKNSKISAKEEFENEKDTKSPSTSNEEANNKKDDTKIIPV